LSKPTPADADLEGAIAAAYTHFRQQDGLTPHAIIEELIGLDSYRRFMGCFDTEALAAYAEDTLPFEEALRVASHEERCLLCRNDITDMRRFVRQAVAQLYAALPAWVTPFVGREEQRGLLEQTLTQGSAPALTLTADPGMGKTRLLLETAIAQAPLFPDGVWYVPVGGVEDAALAASEIARALNLPPERKIPPQEQLRAFLADRNALLVLDEVGTGSPLPGLIGELMEGAAGLRCLATATAPLGLPGERRLTLPPLRLQPQERSMADPLASESVQLFAAHVHAHQAEYVFSEAEARAAAALCEWAGGIPLGIELAAAHVPTMTPQEILRRMEREAPPADRGAPSLQSLLDWAYHQLSPQEQAFLQAMSVFEGGFSIEQAQAVFDFGDAAHLTANLHQWALLQRGESAGKPRYQLLSPIRRFARLRLGAGAPVVQMRHMAYFLQYAQMRAEHLSDRRQIEAAQELSADLPNIRAGMEWAQTAGEWRTVGRYGMALRSFLLLHGDWQECADRLRLAVDSFERVEDQAGVEQSQLALANCLIHNDDYHEAETLLQTLDTPELQTDASLRAEIDFGQGNIAQRRGRYSEATERFERALQGYVAAGDRRKMARCWLNLGLLALRRGDAQQAERLLLASLAVHRELGDRHYLSLSLSFLGQVAHNQGHLDEAERYYKECLQARQELDDVRGIAGAINNLGRVAQERGDFARAAYCYSEAARRFAHLGDRRNLGKVLGSRGALAFAQEDMAAARKHFEESLQIFREMDDAHFVALALGDLGRITQREGDADDALRLFRESLQQLFALGDQAGAAFALALCGQQMVEQGDYRQGLPALYVAHHICEERNRPERQEVEIWLRQGEQRETSTEVAELQQQAALLTLEDAVALVLRN